MNVIRLILDFLFYRWLADKTSANHLQGTSLINSSISTLLRGGELRYYCLSMMSLADGLQMFYLQAICKRGSRV